MTWSNQVRILGQNFERLGSVIGSGFIAWLRPAIVAINSYMDSIIAAVQRVVNALGQIFGWQMIVDTTGDSIVDDTLGIADAYDDATGAAKKFKQQLLGIDELNNLTTNDGGRGSGDDGLLGGLSGGNLIEPGGITFKPIESDIKDLYSLGKKLSDGLKNLLPDSWDEIYEKARGFGSGLADFLNGLIQPSTFKKIGKTIAGALNTVSDAIISFFKNADWKKYGKAFIEGLQVFFEEIHLSTIGLIIGAIAIKKIGSWIIGGEIISGLSSVLAKKISGDAKFSGGIGKALFGVFKTGLASVGTQITASGGFLNFLTLDMAGLVGEGAVSLGTMIGSSILGGLAAAIGGFWVGTTLTKFIMGDNAPDMSGLEIAQELWDGIKKGDIWQAFGEWWKDLCDGIGLIFSNMIGKVKSNWDTFKDKANKTLNEIGQATADWWNDKIAPWFTKEKWQKLGTNMSNGIKSSWNNFVSWWQNTGFYKWWQGVKEKFSKNSWNWSGIKEGLSKAWENAIQGIKEMWNSFANWLNDKLNFSWDGLTISGKEIIKAGSLNLGKIPTFATGGYPDQGSLFVAGETYGQSEWLGNINGRTGVVSGNEITGIADAIYQTSAQEMELLRQQNNYLIGILNKEFGISQTQIGKAARGYAREYYDRNGRQAYQF